MNNPDNIPHILKAEDIAKMPETLKIHPLNHQAHRYHKFLSDALGMTHLGVHLVRIEPGQESTQFHFHHQEEEFIYILSGRGIAEIGETEFIVAAGDFMGFTVPSAPHLIRNPFTEDLVYLLGGERRDFDICDYPKLQKRLIRFPGERKVVDWSNLEPF